MSTDNWKHRSAGMRCVSCIFFVPKTITAKLQPFKSDPRAESPAQVEVDAPSNLGRCRRHAPTISGFPAVFATDWCGDHKLDENKLGAVAP